jgi:hypothetical protein
MVKVWLPALPRIAVLACVTVSATSGTAEKLIVWVSGPGAVWVTVPDMLDVMAKDPSTAEPLRFSSASPGSPPPKKVIPPDGANKPPKGL